MRHFADPIKCLRMDLLDRDLLNKLWNILPYAGLYEQNTLQVTMDRSVPEVRETSLFGIPIIGGNTGSDHLLKLITFTGSTNGPVRLLDGPKIVFFNNLLTHTIRWEAKPISKQIDKYNVESFSIGFYTANYTTGGVNTNRLLPMISTQGPAFYEGAGAIGTFEISHFNSFYVVVNANVSVNLYITYQAPLYTPEPYLSTPFSGQKLYVTDPCRKSLEVTKTLLQETPAIVLLRPADKYIDLSQEMIVYLTSASVEIDTFKPLLTRLPKTTYKDIKLEVSGVRQDKTFDINYDINATGVVGASNNGKSLTYDSGGNNSIDVLVILNVTTAPTVPLGAVNTFFKVRAGTVTKEGWLDLQAGGELKAEAGRFSQLVFELSVSSVPDNFSIKVEQRGEGGIAFDAPVSIVAGVIEIVGIHSEGDLVL